MVKFARNKGTTGKRHEISPTGKKSHNTEAVMMGDADPRQDDYEEEGGGGGDGTPAPNLAHLIRRGDGLRAIRAIVERQLRRDAAFLRRPSERRRIPLHDAIEAGASFATVRYLVEKCPDSVHIKTSEGDAANEDGDMLPLHLALRNRVVDKRTIRFLVRKGAGSLQERTQAGWLPLHLALMPIQDCRKHPLGNGIVLPLIVGWPHALTERGGSHSRVPLHGLLQCSHGVTLELVQQVVDAFPGALLVRDDDGAVPIHEAAYNEAMPFPVLRYLVQRCPEALRVKTMGGELPLHLAFHSPAENLRLLVESWPGGLLERDVDDGNLAIHRAASGNTPMSALQLLVRQCPGSVRATNRMGRTPLHHAAIAGCLRMVHFFVTLWPEGVHEPDVEGWWPLHAAVHDTLRIGPCGDVVQYLAGLSPRTLDVADRYGRLPLHLAVDRPVPPGSVDASLATVRALLEARPAAVRRPDHGGNLPLHAALRRGAALSIVRCLVERHPRSLAVRNNEGLVPVQVSIQRNEPSLDVIQYLVEQRPDTARDVLPSVLDNAFFHSDPACRLSLIQFLLQQCPDAAQVRDGDGMLPFHRAAAVMTRASSRPHDDAANPTRHNDDDDETSHGLDVVYVLVRLRPDLVARSIEG